jgi:hypothetical protein
MKKPLLPLLFVGLFAMSALSHYRASGSTAPSPLSTAIANMSKSSAPAVAGTFPDTWIHGADCVNDPKTQVHAYDPNTYILRQSKCETYEAPFLYLLFGETHALLMDTGANPNTPVQAEVKKIIQKWLRRHDKSSIKLIVQHTHGHFDHVAGDGQFGQAFDALRQAVPAAVPLEPAPPPPVDYRGTRRAARIRMAEHLKVMVDGHAATLVDLSVAGAQVVSGAVLRPNHRVRVVMADDRASVRCVALVAWASFEIPPKSVPHYRAGLQFLDANPADVEAYCERHREPVNHH